MRFLLRVLRLHRLDQPVHERRVHQDPLRLRPCFLPLDAALLFLETRPLLPVRLLVQPLQVVALRSEDEIGRRFELSPLSVEYPAVADGGYRVAAADLPIPDVGETVVGATVTWNGESYLTNSAGVVTIRSEEAEERYLFHDPLRAKSCSALLGRSSPGNDALR